MTVMTKRLMANGAATFVAVILSLGVGPRITAEEVSAPTYAELRSQFSAPDHAQWGEVPLWWWEGQPMTKRRATEQLEELASQGVMSVCPIQRSPGRCDPQSFIEGGAAS